MHQYLQKEGTPEHGLVSIEVCTETRHHVLHDGWRSFPSGHSSSAFAGLGFLALYVACFTRLTPTPLTILGSIRFMTGQMHVLRPRTNLASVLLALLPLIGAALIAVSRLEDYRHDPYDVTVGSTLGMTVAYLSYRRYYPALRSAGCDAPYPSRAESMKGKGSRLMDDGEDYENERGLARHDRRGDDPRDDEEAVPLRRVSSSG